MLSLRRCPLSNKLWVYLVRPILRGLGQTAIILIPVALFIATVIWIGSW